MEAVSHLLAFPGIGVSYKGVTYRGSEVRVLNIRQNALVYAAGENQIIINVFWNNRQNPTRLKIIVSSR